MATENSPGMGAGAHVEDGVVIENDVTIGANAVVLASNAKTGACEQTLLKTGAVIGANATIYAGLVIGERSLIMPGSVVTRSVPPLAIVQGNPAIIVGYVASLSADVGLSSHGAASEQAGVTHSKVRGVTFHRLRVISDLRGNLAVGEFERDLPFTPKRCFFVFDVPTAETRGEHAHYHCHQFLVCVKGSCAVVADDGETREEFLLTGPDHGLHLPPMTWGIQYKYSADAVLLVFASEYYDPADYIRHYEEFVALAKQRRSAGR